MDVITKFINKTTVLIRAYVYDEDGELVDPTTSIKVTINDPAGATKVTAQAMTKNGSNTGVYDYFYDTDADSAEGDWPGEVWVVDGSVPTERVSVGTFSFEVKAGL